VTERAVESADVTGVWRGRWMTSAATGDTAARDYGRWQAHGGGSSRWACSDCVDTEVAPEGRTMAWDTDECRQGNRLVGARAHTSEISPANLRALELLQAWLAEDPSYDRETWTRLKRAVEENRLSERSRFGD